MKLILMVIIFLCIREAIPQQQELIYVNASLNLKLYIYVPQELKSLEEAQQKCEEYGTGIHIAYEMHLSNIFMTVTRLINTPNGSYCAPG